MDLTSARRRPLVALVALVLATGVALTACSAVGGNDSQSSEGLAGPAPAEQPGAKTDTGSKPDASTGQVGVPVKVPLKGPQDQRSIVYKGELTIRASNVDEAAASASTIASGVDGFVSADNRRDSGQRATADLTLRIPSANFYDAVGKLSELGEELNRAINTDDVTEAVIDVDSRIASQQASVDRTRVLLARAERIADIVSIEQELAKREAELASLQARKRSLSDQVTLSTITVRLVGKAAVVTKEEPKTGFLAGLSAGWNGLTFAVNAGLTVLGALLPFLVILAIPLVIVFIVHRRRRRPMTPPPPVTEPSS